LAAIVVLLFVASIFVLRLRVLRACSTLVVSLRFWYDGVPFLYENFI
jgi:hypothetical protein